MGCQPNVPNYTIIWKKGEEVLNFTSLKYVRLQSGDLIINNAESKDAGDYSCNAVSHYYSNPGKLPLLSMFTLSLEPPEGTCYNTIFPYVTIMGVHTSFISAKHQLEFLSVPISQFVSPGASFNLSCVAKGSYLTYVWLKDDKPLQAKKFGNCVVGIQSSEDSSGNYTCVVSNGQVNISATAIIVGEYLFQYYM